MSAMPSLDLTKPRQTAEGLKNLKHQIRLLLKVWSNQITAGWLCSLRSRLINQSEVSSRWTTSCWSMWVEVFSRGVWSSSILMLHLFFCSAGRRRRARHAAQMFSRSNYALNSPAKATEPRSSCSSSSIIHEPSGGGRRSAARRWKNNAEGCSV